ncbi:LOW QUALITY PROTEIN: beta-1,3-galactosyltransferase 6-like [Gigantopelta aegis]|uniref:LOW QUALITY PROTEIN: beta-1,3-galactosyltransferase 6-like n=1 Tax=Gigantopelta aegis TaxID=1735272 RepID=UPI001B88982E|nr:LOW QUALITY PROTEIN: beta-1,3-galactosyltransferase 6-like [Gigantopelta aegis]
MYSNHNAGFIERKLNRHATTILIGGIFLTLSGLMYMAMCTMSCDDRTYGLVKDDLVHAQSKAFWKKHFLAPSRELTAHLVVLVLTAPDYRHQRDAIRETWLQNLPKNCLVRFVIGTASLEESLSSHIEREQTIHKDLLLLSEHKETYTALTSKLLQAFKWLDQNVDFQYVLKVDDDSFARLDLILDVLKSKPKERLYWGFFDGRAHVKKLGKWAEKDWIACDRYLPYALGGGYVLSNDLIHFVVSNANYLKMFLSEDVSLGSWLAPLDINRVHDSRFDTEYKSRGCNNAYLVTHKQSVIQMRDLYQNIQSSGKLCRSEHRVRNSYIYNWHTQPTFCCIRNDSSIP